MRVNIYAEEITDRVELVTKTVDGHEFVGIRFYLELPVTMGATQVQGPFIHREGDDDSGAVTFWGKRDMLNNFERAVSLLYQYYKFTDIHKEDNA